MSYKISVTRLHPVRQGLIQVLQDKILHDYVTRSYETSKIML